MISDYLPPRQADGPRLRRAGEGATSEGSGTGTLLRRIDIRDAVVPNTADALDRFFMDTPRSDDSLLSDWSLLPAAARVQDFLDGGSDNYLVDRALGTKLRAIAYWLPDSVRINRAHGPRILAYVTKEFGIGLGCGLFHDGNRRLPDAVRLIVYVDNAPVVEGHAWMVLTERTSTVSLLADLTDMSGLLAAPAPRNSVARHPARRQPPTGSHS